MMTILWAIYIACIIAWLLPPFRQYKTKYFYYFLCLALADPATIVMHEVLNIELWQGHAITSILDIAILISLNKFNKLSVLLPVLVLPLVLIIPVNNNFTLHNIVAFNCLIVLAIISKDFFINTKETGTIKVFYIALLLYNISGIMKILFRNHFVSTGHIYFFVANFFQLFIAVYFTFYNINNSKKVLLRARNII